MSPSPRAQEGPPCPPAPTWEHLVEAGPGLGVPQQGLGGEDDQLKHRTTSSGWTRAAGPRRVNKRGCPPSSVVRTSHRSGARRKGMHEAVPLPTSPRLRGWALLSQASARVPVTPTLSQEKALPPGVLPVAGVRAVGRAAFHSTCSSRGAPLPRVPVSQAPCTTHEHPFPRPPPPDQASLSEEPTDRLPEGQEDLAAQHVEEVAGRGAVDHHPVAVVELSYVEVGLLEVLQEDRSSGTQGAPAPSPRRPRRPGPASTHPPPDKTDSRSFKSDQGICLHRHRAAPTATLAPCPREASWGDPHRGPCTRPWGRPPHRQDVGVVIAHLQEPLGPGGGVLWALEAGAVQPHFRLHTPPGSLLLATPNPRHPNLSHGTGRGRGSPCPPCRGAAGARCRSAAPTWPARGR